MGLVSLVGLTACSSEESPEDERSTAEGADGGGAYGSNYESALALFDAGGEFDPVNIGELDELSRSLEDPATQAAVSRVRSFLQENCPI